MSAPDLAAIEARAAAATEGPWKLWGMAVMADPTGNSNVDDAHMIAVTSDPHRGLRTWNATFIAHAREDVPALVARVRELEAELAEAKAQTLEEAAADFEDNIGVGEFDELARRDGRRWNHIDDAWEYQGPYMDWLRARAASLRCKP